MHQRSTEMALTLVHFDSKVEQEEEYIANRLLKRLDSLKREKQVCVRLTMQRHPVALPSPTVRLSFFNLLCIMEVVSGLWLVRQVLATEVEQEEEYLVNNLQKRMGKLNLEKTELEKELEKLHRKVLRFSAT